MPDEREDLKVTLLCGRLNALLRELVVRVNRRKGGGWGDLGDAVLSSSSRIALFQGDRLEHMVGIQRGAQAVLQKEGLLQDNNLVITNDPYHGGTDFASFLGLLPVYLSAGQPAAFLALRMRTLDTGGAHPGYADPSATQIYSEGHRVTPVVLAKGSRIFADVWRSLLSNNRMPHVLDADLGALWQGLNWCRGEIEKILTSKSWGVDPWETLQGLVEIAKENTAHQLKTEGQGSGSATVVAGDARFSVCVQVRLVPEEGPRVVFAGSSPQVAAPFNSPLSRTVATTLKILAGRLGLTRLEDVLGLFHLVAVEAPRGSIVHPNFPAACSCSQPFTTFAIEQALTNALAQTTVDKAQEESRPPFYVLLRRELTPLRPYEVRADFGKASFRTYYRGGEWLEFTSENWPATLEESECGFPVKWLSAELSDGGPTLELSTTMAVECSYIASGSYCVRSSADGEQKPSVRLVPWPAGGSLMLRLNERGIA